MEQFKWWLHWSTRSPLVRRYLNSVAGCVFHVSQYSRYSVLLLQPEMWDELMVFYSGNIPEAPTYGFHTWYVMLRFVRNMNIFCSEDLFWFQSYRGKDIIHGNCRLLLGNSMVVIKTLLTNLTLLCHMCWRVCSTTVTWLVLGMDRDGYRMWGRKCSLFPEHMISLPLGSSYFHPFTIYAMQKCSVYGLCLQINDSSLFVWISLIVLSRTYFITRWIQII